MEIAYITYSYKMQRHGNCNLALTITKLPTEMVFSLEHHFHIKHLSQPFLTLLFLEYLITENTFFKQ